jgi:hypothetical protein
MISPEHGVGSCLASRCRLLEMRQETVGGRLGSRVVFDRATNTQWVVFEIRNAPYDRRDGRSLVFSTDGVMRRVRNYPENWVELGDDDLLQVSHRR